MSSQHGPSTDSTTDTTDGQLNNLEHTATGARADTETGAPAHVVNHNVIDTNQNAPQQNNDNSEDNKPTESAVLSESYIKNNMENKINVGCVKWFNIKVGYGFVTINHDEHSYDLFVHHSAIKTNVEIYRYLVQGEYVQFEWGKTSNKNYKFQAINVSGINAGKLMCETRNESRQNHFSHDRTANGKDRDRERNKGHSAPSAKAGDASSSQWTVVKRSKSSGGAKGRGGGKPHPQETE